MTRIRVSGTVQHGYGIYTTKGVKQYGEWSNGKKTNWIINDQIEKVESYIDNLRNKFEIGTLQASTKLDEISNSSN